MFIAMVSRGEGSSYDKRSEKAIKLYKGLGFNCTGAKNISPYVQATLYLLFVRKSKRRTDI